MCSESHGEDIFQCKMCGDCCEGYGGTYITEQDIQRIAEFIGADPATFIDDYCDISCGKPVIKRGENGKCVFFDTACSIHPVKPRMCKAWPFLESVLSAFGNWAIMATACPGIRTGVPEALIRKQVREEIDKLNQAEER